MVLVGSFFSGSFPPAGYLRVSLSPTSCLLLSKCGQVVLELVLLCVQGFEAFLLLFFSCLFLVISSLFICIFKYVLGGLSVASPPSFTFFSSHLLVIPLLVGFLFQEESWCSQLLRTLFFMVGLLWAMGLRAEPSLIRTLPGACVSVPSEMRCRHSPVTGHTPGHWAPCSRWCLQSQLPLR